MGIEVSFKYGQYVYDGHIAYHHTEFDRAQSYKIFFSSFIGVVVVIMKLLPKLS